MPQEAFVKLEPKEIAAVLRDVNPLLDRPAFAAETTTILAQKLMFLPGYRLLDISDFSLVPAAQCFAVHQNGRAVILDGTNGPVYKLARDAPLKLDADRALAYMRFFFQQVSGAGGKFVIVETVEDIPWLGDPPLPLRKEVGRRLIPLVPEKLPNGAWLFAARLLLGNGLFGAQVTVAPDGAVSIADQDLLIEDLSVRDGTLDA